MLNGTWKFSELLFFITVDFHFIRKIKALNLSWFPIVLKFAPEVSWSSGLL